MSPRYGRTLALSLLALLGAVAIRADDVTLYRDTWGVPHIYADSREAAAYGHGYAQAEDRLEDLLRAYLVAVGRAASVFGPDAVDGDVVARIARHEEIARSRYHELKPDTRRLVEAYVAGIRDYMLQHPDAVPSWGRPPEPHHVVALYRAFAWVWPWGQARGDLKRAGSHVDDGRGSNQWVVGPSRSARGVPIALIDPHLSWDPVNRFYEAHVHGGDLHFYGFSIIGTPVMAMGHTDVLSFALTTGGPDCADVYEEKIHPENPLKYEYDGEWRTIEVEQITIEVKARDGIRQEPLDIERTHHGPILERGENRAWTARTAYDREIGIVEQWLGMVRARNLGEFLNAMRANQSLPQNVMYADVHGNTYYVRAGRVPVRPEGLDPELPLAGWSSKTEWLGIHPFSDLVQILNPPGGFMQNCNVSPGTMMPNSPLTPDRYRGALYNERADRSNSRGRRVLELLGSRPELTLEDALAIAVDTYVDGADRWQRAVAAAYETHGARFPSLKPAVDLLREWDGHVDVESRPAPLFRFWMRACREDDANVPRSKIAKGVALTDSEQVALLEALERAAESPELGGETGVAWGELHRIRRGSRSWPVAGCRADGISTLRSVRFSSPDADGISWARGGQICTTVVVLTEGDVVSFSATPYGQSNDPRSPNYADQTELLFSRSRLKPTWFARSDLLEHLQSERTLTFSPPRSGSDAGEGAPPPTVGSRTQDGL